MTTCPPRIMGILNVTPDSFYDGGCYQQQDVALRRAETLINEGADIIDIGGESTRPGAVATPIEVELDRVIPLIECLSTRFDTPLSIDTQKVPVMKAAINQGVNMINDVNALQAPGATELLAQHPTVTACLMHKQGLPSTMQTAPEYQDVIASVLSFLNQRLCACLKDGIKPTQIILDPGFGFGKTVAHNLALLHQLPRITALGYPVLVGVSRKFFIGRLLGKQEARQQTPAVFSEQDAPPEDRLHGSLGAASIAVYHGASIIRTHDVKATREAITIAHATRAYTHA